MRMTRPGFLDLSGTCYFNLCTLTAWPQRRGPPRPPPSPGAHLLNSGCHLGVSSTFIVFPSLGPQLEGGWDQDDQMSLCS